MSKANALVGFPATIVSLFWLVTTATAPKYTTDDIMRKLENDFPNLNYKIDSGFADVIIRLKYIEIPASGSDELIEQWVWSNSNATESDIS